jgi:hypothetical protein
MLNHGRIGVIATGNNDCVGPVDAIVNHKWHENALLFHWEI